MAKKNNGSIDLFNINGDHGYLIDYDKSKSNKNNIKNSGLKLKLGTKDEINNLMDANLFTSMRRADWYNKCNRYGWIDPYDHDRVTKEYLFFTKPDLNIFNRRQKIATVSNINQDVKHSPTLYEIIARMPNVVGELQSSIRLQDEKTTNPFMYLLTNSVDSKLDLPGISTESQESTSNTMGVSIQYRGSSIKSDNGYDFSLSFKDTAYLEVYHLAKAYDEYMRLTKLGLIAPRKEYIKYRILQEQFSIYKFLVGSDGETILYYAKLTGCYFTDVPRSDMSDPQEQIKFSLSFHAQFVEDMNPRIIVDFNDLVKTMYEGKEEQYKLMPIYDNKLSGVNNRWGDFASIERVPSTDKRVQRRNHVRYDYRLKWYERKK